MNVFRGHVDDAGKPHMDAPKQLAAYWRHLAGQDVEVEIRKRKSRRSVKANAFWWAAVIPPLCAHTGYTPDEMHEALKAKFLGAEDLSTGLRRIGSTAALDTAAFAELTDRVILWAAEHLGVVIEGGHS